MTTDDNGPSLADALAELPIVAEQAANAVLELYEAIRQAKLLGASYGQLASATGVPRSTVQDIIAGRVPKFTVPE